MNGTVSRALSKSAPTIEFVDVAARLESITRLLGSRYIGRLLADGDQRETIESLSDVREAARRIANVWPEQRARCSRAIAAIDRVLSRFADRPSGAKAVHTVAAGSAVRA
jgi:hypothetical protein